MNKYTEELKEAREGARVSASYSYSARASYLASASYSAWVSASYSASYSARASALGKEELEFQIKLTLKQLGD